LDDRFFCLRGCWTDDVGSAIYRCILPACLPVTAFPAYAFFFLGYSRHGASRVWFGTLGSHLFWFGATAFPTLAAFAAHAGLNKRRFRRERTNGCVYQQTNTRTWSMPTGGRVNGRIHLHGCWAVYYLVLYLCGCPSCAAGRAEGRRYKSCRAAQPADVAAVYLQRLLSPVCSSFSGMAISATMPHCGS